MSKVAERKARLHEQLIEAAETRIEAHSVGRLHARDLAADVGCSIGTIYNLFDDLDALILHVSFRTLKRIDTVMAESIADTGETEPLAHMVTLGRTYCDFAVTNRNLWGALFEHALPADYPLPGWVLEGQLSLFRHIEKPLTHYMKGSDPMLVGRTARSLFSMVHGMVSLSLERRVSGVNLDMLNEQTEFMIRTFVKGLEAS
ncbi:TetR/AcrR family transcriptional regulator [Ahrensia sp. R2A130]|uniref:TetR/AcrR family transcriptional regulator n=1 Tax=Ahrensia sp. R2A130 TaxID=744979 RepID=UPI0001E08C7C|nr:TetR/AcrR family transcriptional regulator [Ahrensia sp. R2A130]EFL89105.1 transcriptional regulatory protein [Ahrensia sp. R2A130]